MTSCPWPALAWRDVARGRSTRKGALSLIAGSAARDRPFAIDATQTLQALRASRSKGPAKSTRHGKNDHLLAQRSHRREDRDQVWTCSAGRLAETRQCS